MGDQDRVRAGALVTYYMLHPKYEKGNFYFNMVLHNQAAHPNTNIIENNPK